MVHFMEARRLCEGLWRGPLEYVRRMGNKFGWRFCVMLFSAYFGRFFIFSSFRRTVPTSILVSLCALKSRTSCTAP